MKVLTDFPDGGRIPSLFDEKSDEVKYLLLTDCKFHGCPLSVY